MEGKRTRPHFIEVGFKPNVTDALGESTSKTMKEDLGINAEKVNTISKYLIDADLKVKDLEKVKDNLFVDPITQVSSLDKELPKDFDYLIEIGFKPGVTDNVGKTSKQAIQEITKKEFKEGEAVYSFKQYLLKGEFTREQVEKVGKELLANELIETITVVSRKEWQEKGLELRVPKVKLLSDPKVREIDLNVSNEELMRISKEGVLALNLNEMKKISEYFKKPEVLEERKKQGLGDKPTDVELEVLAQTWSDHCKHKTFNARIKYADRETGKKMDIDSLYKSYIMKATEEIGNSVDYLVSVFEDNAGVVKFNKDWNLVMKVETHNSPSALDPYGGAITGIVGVNRDPMGTGIGARLIFNTDLFCFASPFYKGKLPPRILHPKRILYGVRKGVEDGGNQSGIPTIGGGLYFNDRFAGKPLVYVGTGGLMPSNVKGWPAHKKEVKPGDLIVMLGGKIGKDGIHGATFSSEELHEGSPATAVQVGDAITQKVMYDFIMEARDKGYYKAITDNGAGGLSSSIGEMAEISGGFEMDLSKAPLKYAGLDPWEITISESQERMSVAVSPEYERKFFELAKLRGVEATNLGTFNNKGYFHAKYKGKTVAFIDMNFLHHGVPQLSLEAVWKKPKNKEPVIKKSNNLSSVLKKMLGRENICSREWIIRQYDHEVQGGSVVKPLVGVENDGPSDAAIIRPLLDSMEGVIVSHGLTPNYSDIDTYHMAACAINEAIRNIIAVGGNLDFIVFNDNFCWPSPIYDPIKTPDGKYKLAQLIRANQALYDYCKAYSTPCISGKDSMSVDYKLKDTDGKEYKISGQPTLLISAAGKIKDVKKAVTMDVKAPGDLVYVVGLTLDELGGSEYYAMHKAIGNNVPKVDAVKSKKLFKAMSRAIEKGLVASCHDCSEGGLGVALAESSFAGGFGMDVDLRKVPVEGINREDFILFSESQSRFVVTVPEKNKNAFEKELKGNTFGLIGNISKQKTFRVKGLDGKEVINTNIDDLKKAWKRTMDW